MALDAILAHKREELAARQAAVPLAALQQRAVPTTLRFAEALRRGRPGFILKVKFASP